MNHGLSELCPAFAQAKSRPPSVEAFQAVFSRPRVVSYALPSPGDRDSDLNVVLDEYAVSGFGTGILPIHQFQCKLNAGLP